MINRDLYEEIAKTNGIKILIDSSSGQFAEYPNSAIACFFVFIDIDSNKNTYTIEFFHEDKSNFIPKLILDKKEEYKTLDVAVDRYIEVTNIIHNILIKENKENKI